MADQKQGGQPQGGQPQGGQSQSGQPQGAPLKGNTEQINRAQEYQKQLVDAQNKYLTKYKSAWTKYYENLENANKEYQESVQSIHEGARKAHAPQPSTEGKSPEESYQAFKAARSKNLHSAVEVSSQLRQAERKYNQKLSSFWDDVFESVSEAVQDFWDWIIGWWEEPPVEGGQGGGGGGPFRITDPAWRAAFEHPAAAYYGGWNYAASLY